MRNPQLLFLSSLLLLQVACKKSTSTTPTTPVTPTPVTSPYYFTFKLDTASYNLTANNPQYDYGYTFEVGGYQDAASAFYPSIGLTFDWRHIDTVKESDVLGLAGKTIYFNDTNIHPTITFDKDASSDISYSADTANTAYNVKITGVTFLKKDTVLGYPVRTYVMTGSCSAVLYVGSSYSILSAGTFKFVISRNDL